MLGSDFEAVFFFFLRVSDLGPLSCTTLYPSGGRGRAA